MSIIKTLTTLLNFYMVNSLSQSRKIRSFILVILSLLGISLIIVVPLLVNTINEKSDLSTHLEKIKKATNEVIYYDEILTSSARIFIVDPNIRWKERYDKAAKSLDESLSRAIELDPLVNEAMLKVSSINDELIEIETKVFTLVEQGKLALAKAKMFDARYDELKSKYNSYVQQALDKTKHLTEQQCISRKNLRLRCLLSYSFVCHLV